MLGAQAASREAPWCADRGATCAHAGARCCRWAQREDDSAALEPAGTALRRR